MLKSIRNLFAKKSNVATNPEVIALLQQQAETIAKLQAQLNVAPVANTNVAPVTNHLAEEQARTYDKSIDRSSYNQSRNFTSDERFEEMDWREIQRTKPELINVMIDELRESILTSLNPSYYKGVMEDRRVELLQQYYMMKLIVKGQYNPEVDNLDSLSKSDLIQAIYELEVEDWAERQERKGKSPFASPKQLELLKSRGVDTINIKYWFEASVKLEEIFGSYDNTVTKAQTDLITKLVGELQLQGYDMTVTTKKEASVKIEELTKLHEEKFGAKKPTKAQYELYARYLKLNNKRLTQSAKDKMMAMSARELSDAITELKKKYNAEHPEASEGQVNYIISLCEQMMKPYDIASIRALDKVSATAKIDQLTREQLFIKMRRDNASVTMEIVNALSKDEVKAKLDEYKPQR